MFGRGILWRNLGKPIKVGPIDGRCVIFIMIAAYHWAMWTFLLAVIGVVALAMVERMGYSIPNLMRMMGVFVVGKKRPHQTARRMRSDI